MQIVDEDGADALSMRALAQRLESGTATLYRHFANRGEVIAHVVDRMYAKVELNAEELAGLKWQLACKSFAQATFEALRRHRNVARLLAEQVPVGPHAMALRERVLAALLDNGFSPQLAAHTYATLARYVVGFAIQPTSGQSEDSELARLFHTLDPEIFPATRAVADYLPVPLEEEFALGLELIVNGLAMLPSTD